MDTQPLYSALEGLDFSRLTMLCEECELDAATEDKPHPHATMHLLSLLLQDDLTEARFLWRRLPTICKEQPDTAAAWALVKAIWQSDFAVFYSAAKHPAWGEADSLVSALVDATRQKGVELITRAYSCVKLKHIGALLGLDDDDVVQLCEREGWTIASEFAIVERRNSVSDVVKTTGDSRELRMLTEQLVRLQTSG